MELHIVPIDKPDDLNVIVGQSHFIKTVEDVHEALIGVSPHLRFGIAFCEASGPRLVRRSGNDDELVELATKNALAVGAATPSSCSCARAIRSTCSTSCGGYRRSAASSARPPIRWRSSSPSRIRVEASSA